MKLSTLDKVFGNYLVATYADNLNRIDPIQIMDLRMAFYAGATIMVDAASQEPPLSFEEGQGLLDDIVEFRSHIREAEHNRAVAVAILASAQLQNNKVSKN